MRVHLQNHNNNGNKGRSYALLVLLAFGAAIFGVMTLHKLRDRRICALLVKDKDIELNTLQLLLQKEREHAKEAERQIEDMKTDIQWLRTQKNDLGNRILEMKSTISSLKEEQKTTEAALEEKQGEIKMLREKDLETRSDNSQVTLLSETLRQKEAEIEDLKRRLEVLPAKVWSVSTDDPSNPLINSTPEAAGRFDGEDQKNSAEEIDSSADKSAHESNEDVTGQGDDTAKVGERSENVNGKAEEQSQQLKTSQDDVPGNSTISQINEGQRENADQKRYTNDDASHSNEDDRNQVQKQSNEVGENDKGMMKLEMQENSKSNGISRVTKGYLRKRRGKRRHIIAKHQVDESGMLPESRGIASMRNRKFLKVKKGTETVERVGGGTLEIKDRQRDRDMDVDMRKKPDNGYHGIEMTNKVQQGEDSGAEINNQIMSEQGGESDTGKRGMQDVSTNHEDSPPGKTSPNPNNFAYQRIEMANKIQQDKDLEVQINNQIRSEQGGKLDIGRHGMQDVSTNHEDTPPSRTSRNSNNFAEAEERNQEVVNPAMSQKIEKAQEKEVSNTETKLLQSSREEGSSKTALSKESNISQDARNKKPDEIVHSKEIPSAIREDTEARQDQNLPNSSEHATISERDVKDYDQEFAKYQETEQEGDHSGRSQNTRNQKADNTARTEGKNDTIREDREQKHVDNLHYPSEHAKISERDIEGGAIKVENDKETEEEAGSTKGSTASFGEEGEDGDRNDEPEF